MDIRELLHNKWAVGGVAAAGVVGLVVYMKRKSAGGGGGDSGGVATASPGYTPGGVGSFDTTGTDIAGWLSSYSGNLQGQLDSYQQQLTDTLAGLQKVPTSGGTGSTSSGGSTTASPQFVTVAKWTTKNAPWNSTLSGIAKHEGTSVATLLKLNPNIKNPDVIITGSKVRVK